MSKVKNRNRTMLLLIKMLPFWRFMVYGDSMHPLIPAGKSVITCNWWYKFRTPKKGDIVVLCYMNRLIIKIIDYVKDGQVFVIGINKRMSTDSRQYGLLPQNNIVGKVVFF